MNKKLFRLSVALLSLPILLLGMPRSASAYTTQDVLGMNIPNEQAFTISSTGRYIGFTSPSPDLAPNDLNGKSDAFIKDNNTGTVKLVSATPAGASGNAQTNQRIFISGNGRFVLFNSQATNLSSTPGEFGKDNVYLRDLKLQTTTLIAKGIYGAGVSQYAVGISEDARFVYYRTDGGGSPEGISVVDRLANTTARVDVNSSGVLGNSGASTGGVNRSVSCDGRFIVFQSSSSNLVINDMNNSADIFLVDTMNGHFIKNITLQGNAVSRSPEISCDGNYVLFGSQATNLVSGDTNNTEDLFQYNVSDETIKRVSVKNDGSEFIGTTGAVGDGAYGGFATMSMDGEKVFFIHTSGYSAPSGSLRQSLMYRNTVTNTTVKLVDSFSSSVNKFPASTYDGKSVYYFNSAGVQQAPFYIRQVTGY